jgi:uncharacterized protein
MKISTHVVLIFFILISCRGGVKSRMDSGTDHQNDRIKEKGDTSSVTLYQAAIDGDYEALKQLLKSGIDVDYPDQDGRTALMYASYYGHTEIMKYLISCGASVNRADLDGSTPLMMASSGPFAESVKLLLSRQADPNMADREAHYTALMYAASEGQLDVVRVLLTGNADPFFKNVEGNDALSFAIKNNHMQVADVLQSFMHSTGRK